jgi:hypothetical protein
MRGIAFVSLGLLGGFVLGGIGPRRELHFLRGTHAEQTESVCEPTRASSAISLPGFDQILRVEPESETRTDELSPTNDQNVVAERPQDAADAGVSAPVARVDSQEALHLAAEAQAIRAAQTRAALIEDAELSHEEEVELDRIVSQMNEHLLGYAEEIQFLVLSGEQPPTGQMLGIVHDVTGVLHDGQLALDHLIDGRTSALPRDELAIWNLVDLRAIEAALESESGSP